MQECVYPTSPSPQRTERPTSSSATGGGRSPKPARRERSGGGGGGDGDGGRDEAQLFPPRERSSVMAFSADAGGTSEGGLSASFPGSPERSGSVETETVVHAGGGWLDMLGDQWTGEWICNNQNLTLGSSLRGVPSPPRTSPSHTVQYMSNRREREREREGGVLIPPRPRGWYSFSHLLTC